MGKFIDLTGKKFGRWTVMHRSDDVNRCGIMWVCKCDCGTVKNVFGGNLRNGISTSCGCFKKESQRERATKHGELSGSHGRCSRLYTTWKNMRKRCNCKSSPDYVYYGGRGIRICAEWDTYRNFKEWALSHGYSSSLTLDRINVDGDYSPANCRWADRKTQMNNTTRNHIISFNGESHTLTEWAQIKNMSIQTLSNRINTYDWDIHDALSRPVRGADTA